MKTRKGNGTWNVMSPATAGGCSATGYFFGKDLLQNLDCAVGLMRLSCVLTRILKGQGDEYPRCTMEKMEGTGELYFGDRYTSGIYLIEISGVNKVTVIKEASKN